MLQKFGAIRYVEQKMALCDAIWPFSTLKQLLPATSWFPTCETTSYLNWQAIQLDIHSAVSPQIDYMNSYRIVVNCMQVAICFPSHFKLLTLAFLHIFDYAWKIGASFSQLWLCSYSTVYILFLKIRNFKKGNRDQKSKNYANKLTIKKPQKQDGAQWLIQKKS